MNKIIQGLPLIETEHLKLRNFRSEDAREYYLYHNNPYTIRYYDWKPNTLAEALDDIKLIISCYKDLSYIRWAITLKETDTIIGDCGLVLGEQKGEISYILNQKYWGHGFMAEAINAIISVYFRETDVYRIQALSLPENKSSNKLLQKLGFRKEGLLKKYGHNMITNQYIDLQMWATLKEEYHSQLKYNIARIKRY